MPIVRKRRAAFGTGTHPDTLLGLTYLAHNRNATCVLPTHYFSEALMEIKSKLFITYADNAATGMNALLAQGRSFAAELDQTEQQFDKASCRRRRRLEKALVKLTRFAARFLARAEKLMQYCASLVPRNDDADIAAEHDYLRPFDSAARQDALNPDRSSEPRAFSVVPETEELSFDYGISEGGADRILHAFTSTQRRPSEAEIRRILPDNSAFNDLSNLTQAARSRESFGRAIERLRESHNYTIEDFRGSTQVSPVQYNKYRNDEDTPRRPTLQRIITGLSLTPAQAKDLWQKAGYNDYRTEDCFFFACLHYGIYDLDKLNLLFNYFFCDQRTLIRIPPER